MAKLYRNLTTDEYYTETAMDGAFVTLRIHPDGREFLLDQGVEEGDRIPAEMFVLLEENGWLTAVEEDESLLSVEDGVSVGESLPIGNENLSETNAPPIAGHGVADGSLPGDHLNPPPWMEPENVERMQVETNPMATGAGQPEGRSNWTPADRENANPLTHPEDAAFIGGVWFWVLVVAAVAIIVWGLVEIL